jgi:hypothetical protein
MGSHGAHAWPKDDVVLSVNASHDNWLFERLVTALTQNAMASLTDQRVVVESGVYTVRDGKKLIHLVEAELPRMRLLAEMTGGSFVWGGAESALLVMGDEDDDDGSRHYVKAAAPSHEKMAELWEFLRRYLEPAERKKPQPGRIYMVIATREGPHLQSVGQIGHALARDNYTYEVLSGFDTAVGELQAKIPDGRLVIVEGPPGTGKTFMVRGLIEQVTATWVFVPSQMFESLEMPQLLPLLLDRTIRPVILVVEDADRLLANRAGNDTSAISALLNMTSGILGDLLDLRVVVTTNLQNVEIDDAVLRVGRLAARIATHKLGSAEAVRVLGRLIPQDVRRVHESMEFPVTLAELYAIAAPYRKKHEKYLSENARP